MASESVSASVVQHNGREYTAIKEGLAYILKPLTNEEPAEVPKSGLKDHRQQASVFYNPIQQFNRDLSVLAIKVYGEHVLAMKKQKAAKRRQKNEIETHNGRKRKRDHDDDGSDDRPAAGKRGNDIAASVFEEVDVPNNIPSGMTLSDANELRSGVSDPRVQSFQILDALSATGLRALRYAKEISFTTRIISNDLSPSAIQSMKLNIGYNGVGKTVKPNLGDACAYMYSLLGPQKADHSGLRVGRFDVIDLDPYGTASPFLDAAVQVVNDGGLLCVTCTDAGVFTGAGYPEKAFALYGGAPIKGSHSHEAGLRLILNGIATSAAKYGLSIEPLLSLSIDFYARVFVRVYKSPAEVKFVSGNTMLVYNCDSGCGAWSIQLITHTRKRLDKRGQPCYQHSLSQGPISSPYCEHCGFKTHLGGPMWAGPLHNPHFIQRILNRLPELDRDTYQTVGRIEGMLTTALEEDLDLDASSQRAYPERNIEVNDRPALSAIIPRTNPAIREPHPFFVSLSVLSKVLHTQTMPINAFRVALHHLGYRFTRSHSKPDSIRTDAPWDVIWEVMREWARQKSPIKEGALSPGSPGAAIMRKSRENLERDQWLSALQKEIADALQSGRDVLDLKTKVEAALYRCGTRSAQVGSDNEHRDLDIDASTAKDGGTEECSILSRNSGGGDRDERNGTPLSADKAETKPHPHTLTIVFDEDLGAKTSAVLSKKRIVRYQANPRVNWGPMNRASSH